MHLNGLLCFWLIVGGCQALEAGDSVVVEGSGGQAYLALELMVVGGGCEELGGTVKAEMVIAGQDEHVLGVL